jgi:hypothetical protein
MNENSIMCFKFSTKKIFKKESKIVSTTLIRMSSTLPTLKWAGQVKAVPFLEMVKPEIKIKLLILRNKLKTFNNIGLNQDFHLNLIKCLFSNLTKIYIVKKISIKKILEDKKTLHIILTLCTTTLTLTNIQPNRLVNRV